MFNKQQKEQQKALENASKARDERCIPLAKELIKLIATENAIVGSQKSKEVVDNYTKVATVVLNYLLAKNVMFDDVSYIFRLVLEHFQATQDFVVQSLNNSMSKCSDILWKKESSKVSMEDVDKLLKSVEGK